MLHFRDPTGQAARLLVTGEAHIFQTQVPTTIVAEARSSWLKWSRLPTIVSADRRTRRATTQSSRIGQGPILHCHQPRLL